MIAAAAVGLVLAGAAPATSLLPVQKAALEAVRRAVAAGQIDASQAAIDRAEIGRAARLIRGLPAGRGNHVGVALAEVASLSGRLTGPRAVALFGQLKANDDYFARDWAPADKTDITDASGVVYRYFGGRCFEFHPLANFGELNADVARGDVAATRLLADALVARGVYQHGGGIGWEYYFSFGGGRAPWLSGMAQAVAAQALARAATLVTDETTLLTRQARGAYRTIPGRLLTRVAAGPWIRLYAFRSTAVLNAQLQAVISLQSYAAAVEDASAAALAARMQHAAAATLPKFDTGYWTYYSLVRDPSPLDYQRYVVQLLTKLASADPRFADAATRFASYLHQPPAFKLANGGLGEVRFWLSKPATVSAVSAAGKTHHVALDAGWHTLSWREPTRTGTYPVKLSAVDWAGNHVALEALPIVRAAAAQVAQSRRTNADAVAGQPAFVVGAGLDDPAQGTLARALGMRLVRLGVAWPSGATAADPALVAAFQTLPTSLGAACRVGGEPAAGRRRRPGCARPVCSVARPAGARFAIPRAHALAVGRWGPSIRRRPRRDPDGGAGRGSRHSGRNRDRRQLCAQGDRGRSRTGVRHHRWRRPVRRPRRLSASRESRSGTMDRRERAAARLGARRRLRTSCAGDPDRRNRDTDHHLDRGAGVVPGRPGPGARRGLAGRTGSGVRRCDHCGRVLTEHRRRRPRPALRQRLRPPRRRPASSTQAETQRRRPRPSPQQPAPPNAARSSARASRHRSPRPG